MSELASGRVDVRSAGSDPADQVNPMAVAAMREVGIDITHGHPRVLTADDVRAADVVVTMGCGDRCPVSPGKRCEDWNLRDPAGAPMPLVRMVRDQIRERVETLIRELLSEDRAVHIRPMVQEHAEAVLAIYQAGIDEGNATFETTAPSWPDFDRSKLAEHRFVALDDDQTVLGWVAAIAVSDRCVYAGVVEHSVYVSPTARGRGVGHALLKSLIVSTEAAGVWTIQSGIFPENDASVALHRAAGFRVVGTRERIGRQHGVWRDVTLIERRSRATFD
jgi:L-amino acid N-acyltransferase YncA/protein-tyrosine-phosphatase